jgi:hypothetical protein
MVSDDMVLTLNNGPEAPPAAEGPAYVDVFVTTTSDYSTAGFPDVSEYNWYLEPVEAGTIQGAGLNSTVTWNPDFLGLAYITVSATSECGEGEVSATLPVTVDNTVGIGNPENHELGLVVYPNPGDGLFNIQISSEKPGMMKLKLNNVLGETIFSRSVQFNSSSNHQLNLEYLPDGIYFLVVEDNEQSVTKKLVKK